jgi:hypothetical protein
MWAIAIALCVLALEASTVFAQDGASAPAPSPPPSAESAPATPIDPLKLPVSIGRIRLQLSAQRTTKATGLKIQETIDVVAMAPKIQLWAPEEAKLATGPAPWGAPTHKDFIELRTPQEFKRYPIDINALMQWLMEQLAEEKAE